MFPMGQYFKAVNQDKKEVVCPWCLGGGAKLWEWAANPYGAIFTLLLRKSSAGGGGDFYGYRTQTVELAAGSDPAVTLLAGVRHCVAMEGQPVQEAAHPIAGRWAGDRVMLVGDYDDSGIWKELPQYRNITRELVEVWNQFIEIDDLKLRFNPTCNCQEEM
jgi:hypothetical protein